MSRKQGRKAGAGVIFGPVSSRRLGLSLGIDLLRRGEGGEKICPYDCVYCEVGPTTLHTCQRAEYIPAAAIEAEIEAFLAEPFCAPDCFTLTASGEPTLNTGIGRVIRFLKKKSRVPVVVLTNSATLAEAGVRRELAPADIVVPSLDAASAAAFRRVNRPAGGCPEPETQIRSLARLKEEAAGEIWLEILLVKGLNDGDDELAALARAAAAIRPDLVQLNTVVRPPAIATALPLSADEMRRAASLFPGRVEVVAAAGPEGRGRGEAGAGAEARVLAMVARRPCPAEEIARATGLAPAALERLLAAMLRAGRIRERKHQGRRFFTNA